MKLIRSSVASPSKILSKPSSIIGGPHTQMRWIFSTDLRFFFTNALSHLGALFSGKAFS